MVSNGISVDFGLLMQEALNEAQKAWLSGEVPVGAVIADESGEIFARNHNRCISLNDPTAHAEILVIREAARQIENYRLNGMNLFVTLEPCLMCMGAIINARVSSLIFGAFDPKYGAAGSMFPIPEHEGLNHRVRIIAGVCQEDCQQILQSFFRERR